MRISVTSSRGLAKFVFVPVYNCLQGIRDSRVGGTLLPNARLFLVHLTSFPPVLTGRKHQLGIFVVLLRRRRVRNHLRPAGGSVNRTSPHW